MSDSSPEINNLQSKFQRVFQEGVQAFRQGNLNNAIHKFQECLRVQPDSYEALCGLADSYRLVNQLELAREPLQTAINLNPNNMGAYLIQGMTYNAEFQFEQALVNFRQAALISPKNAIAQYNLGLAYYKLFLYPEAEAALNLCLELSADHVFAIYYKARCRELCDDAESAKNLYTYAIELASNQGTAVLSQLAETMKTDALLDWSEMAADLICNQPNAKVVGLVIKANISQQQGGFDIAETYLQQAIELAPNQAKPYFDLIYGRKMTVQDQALLQAMQKLLSTRGLDLESRRMLCYSLGKFFSDIQEYKAAVRYYDEANAAALQQLGSHVYDSKDQAQFVNTSIKTFNTRLFEENKHFGNLSTVPVLIVGMIRSGTTLCEQVISSHPEVGAGGELAYLLYKSFGRMEDQDEANKKAAMDDFTTGYLNTLQIIAPDKAFVTDKSPLNFTNLGAFHIGFPRGKIIHVKRNPAENGLSIYLTPFTPNLDFGHHQDNIVDFYQQYLRLMNHWRRVLPKENLLEINYEDLVLHPEQETRRMADFLGLEWNDAMLHHESNPRIIQTPSQWQARQPMYTSSLNKFHLYEPYLDGLQKLKDLKLPN